MQCIPLELLSEIILYILAPQFSSGNIINLCLVCHGWRNTALIMPQLWRHIRVHPSRSTDAMWPQLLQWIQRSQALPFSLDIPFGTIADLPLNLEQKRLSTLTLHGSSLSVQGLSELFHRFDDWPMLQTLDIVGDLSSALIPSLWLSAKTVPNLKIVRLHLSTPTSSLSLPWAQLEELTLHISIYFSGYMLILQQAKLLKKCVLLCRDFMFQTVSSEQTKITLPHLHSLHLECIDYFRPALPALILPSLDLFCDRQRDGRVLSAISSLKTFFSQSGSNIRILNLQTVAIRNSEFNEVFALTPRVEELTVSYRVCIFGSQVRTENHEDAKLATLPNLTHLVFEVTQDGFDEDSFAIFLRSRHSGTQTTAQLQYLKLISKTGAYSFSRVVESEIEKAFIAGLKFSVQNEVFMDDENSDTPRYRQVSQ